MAIAKIVVRKFVILLPCKAKQQSISRGTKISLSECPDYAFLLQGSIGGSSTLNLGSINETPKGTAERGRDRKCHDHLRHVTTICERTFVRQKIMIKCEARCPCKIYRKSSHRTVVTTICDRCATIYVCNRAGAVWLTPRSD